MADVINRKTIFVSYLFTETAPDGLVQTNISLDGVNFKPDEVVILNPLFMSTGVDNAWSVYFGLVDSEIFVVPDATSALDFFPLSPVTYKLNRNVEGTYFLQFRDYATGAVPVTLAGHLTFTLEFKEYRK